MFEQRGHHNERDGIAERQAMIVGIGPKHAFGFIADPWDAQNTIRGVLSSAAASHVDAMSYMTYTSWQERTA